MTDQVLVVYAGTRGYLDNIPVKDINDFEKSLLAFFSNNTKAITLWKSVSEHGQISSKLDEELKNVFEGFTQNIKKSNDEFI